MKSPVHNITVATASAVELNTTLHSETLNKSLMRTGLQEKWLGKYVFPALSIVCVLLSTLIFNQATAQGTLGRWEMCGLSGTTSSVSPTGVKPGVSFSNFTRGPGINASSASNAFNSTGWSTSSSLNINSNDYYEFTITPLPGHRISISSLKIRDQMSNTSFDVSVRYSDNNYGSTVGSGGSWTASTSATNRTVNMSGVSSLQNRTTPVTFRIYGTDASTSSSTYRILCQGTSSGNYRGVDVDGTVVQAEYASEFISMDYGSSPWCRGELRDVSVTVKNVGTKTWNSEEPVNIGLKWNEDGDYGAGPSFISRQPAGMVESGQTVTYTFPNVAASTLNGNNNLTFDVVRELVCWFANNSGGCGPGNAVFTSPTINVLPSPAATTVSGGGTFCDSGLLSASGGSGGTIYFQGTNPEGTSTSNGGSSATVTESGTYYFRSRNSNGCWGDAGSATVTINKTPVISQQPVGQEICVGGNINLSVTATGTPEPGFQWYKDGNPLPGETNTTLQISNAAVSDGGNYTVAISNSCSTVTSNTAVVVVNETPVITADPQSITICESTALNLSVTATGTNLVYQWYQNGNPISGADASTYHKASATPGDAGSYTVSVSNGGCTSSLSAAATVSITEALLITSQPEGLTVCMDGNASFSVVASGAAPITYQWLKNGSPIDGATASTLNLNGVSTADNGSYTVEVTNECGTITSSSATLVVNVPAAVTVDPVAQSVCEGSQVSFTVSATGTNLEYQWRKNGANISGANSDTYTIAQTASGDAAAYDVVVSNSGCASATSAQALLTVYTRPTATITSSNTTLCSGSPATVSGNVTASGAWVLTLSDNQTVEGNGNGAFSFTVNPVTETGYTLIGLSDENCTAVGADLSGSVTIATNPLPGAVAIDPSNSAICNGSSTVLTGSGSTSESSSTLINNNFTSGVTVTGSVTGNRSQVFERENSGSSINSIGTFSSPNGSGMLVATSGEVSGFCFCVAVANSTANTTAQLAPFNTMGYNSLDLKFNHTYEHALVSGSAVVQVSTDGNNWNTVKTYSSNVGSTNNFINETINLNSYVNQSNVYVRFIYTANNSSSGFLQSSHGTWWAIDDISLSGTLAPLYAWEANTGSGVNGLPTGAGTPSVDNKMISVNPSETTTYTLSAINPVTGCVSSANAEILVNARPTAVLSGDASYCAGENVSAQLTLTVTGSGTISGTLSDGTPFSGTAPSINVMVSPATTTIYTVATLSDENCAAQSEDLSGSATIDFIPLTPVSVSIVSSDDDNEICIGTSVTFTATPVNGGPNPAYQWLLNGDPVGENQNTFTTSTLANGDVVSVVLTSDFTPCAGNNPAVSNGIATIVNPLQPVSVTVTSDVTAACAGSTILFTAHPVNGGDAPQYQWYVNGVAVEDSTGVTFAPAFLEDGDAVSVVLTSNITPCAVLNPATSNNINITISPIPQMPGPITGITNACPYVDTEIPVTFSIDPVPGAASYTWTVPANGVNVISGQGTTELTVTFTNSFALTNQYFRVATNSSFPCTSAPSDHEVLKIVPAIAGPISGPVNVCSYVGEEVTATYSIDPVEYATGYTWTAPPNATIVSGQGTLSVEVSFNTAFVSGSLRVSADANCGARAARSLAIGKTGAQAPGVISGPVNACEFIGGGGDATYTIEPVANATNYEWVVPANCTIVSGQGTTSLTVNFGSNYTSGQIRVRAQSPCNNSGYRSLTVANTIYGAPGLISGPTNACGYIGTGNLATYTIRKVPNAPGYQWTLPTGCIITSHLNGPGENDTIVQVSFDASFVSGSTISVQTVGCFTSAASTLQIMRSGTTHMPGIFSGPTNVCEYMQSDAIPAGVPVAYSVRKANGATSYNWTAPANSTIVDHPNGAGENDTLVHVVFHSNFTSGVISVSAENACGVSAERTLNLTSFRPMTIGGITATEVQTCPNRIITYSVPGLPGNATSIYWTVPDGATLLSGQGSVSISVMYPAGAVNGFVSATPMNNCGSSATRKLSVKLAGCEGGKPQLAKGTNPAAAEVEQLSVSVYPNPSAHQFKLQIQSPVEEQVMIRVMDMTGRELQRMSANPNQAVALGNQLKAGTYFIEVIQQKERVVQKVIKL